MVVGSRTGGLFITVCLVLELGTACSSAAPPPVSERLQARETHRPLVLVPGVTGSKLRRTDTGEVIWGRGTHLISPKDGGYAIARPLSTDLTGDSGVEAFEVIEELRLIGVIRKPIYGPVARTMEANGYQRGELVAPRPGDDFFMFAYDWRDDLVSSANRLAAQLEGLRRKRGEEVLEVDLVCQSAGGQICRYLAKFGDATLEEVEEAEAVEEAEGGSRGPSATIHVNKLVLVATANGGGIRILREIHRGRTYVPGLGRRMRPEVLFSFAALYQDLPIYHDRPFVDGSGRPLDIDLFDSATWVEHGFSIFADEVRERVDGSHREDLFSDQVGRVAALQRFLDRSKRLHNVLKRDVADFSTRYYSIQNLKDETPERAVLREGEDGWELLFAGDKELAKLPDLEHLVTSGGDGHATRTSQLWLAPQEFAALAVPPLEVDGDHFAMIIEREALEGLLGFLAAD